ncbi:hypothetical protein [Rugamonas sp.]|uniref:hypothetical protein n=1 Tax=Rugamonas sp. TaxID=1926287 RepID=UPI0025F81C79|nr:hypothetical protein [Rugamonas sp.]
MSSETIHILLQTTIVYDANDWHIGRFGLLRDYLAALTSAGRPLFRVTARDRGPIGAPDPVLSTLDASDYDEVWLFAVDSGDGLHPDDVAGLERFRRRGGGLMVTRDHMDLGCSICRLEGIGAAHLFHSHNASPDHPTPAPDDRGTPAILWPNFHSGANGDYQVITPAGPLHAVLRDPDADDGAIGFLPAHPHEGAVAAPPGDASARVIATGVSKVSGAPFNLAVAFERSATHGPALAESTFHHFADYNWDPASGCPDFVSEQVGGSLPATPAALRAVRRYVLNLALWLAGRLADTGPTVAVDPVAS